MIRRYRRNLTAARSSRLEGVHVYERKRIESDQLQKSSI
jgi:hypothetical protein